MPVPSDDSPPPSALPDEVDGLLFDHLPRLRAFVRLRAGPGLRMHEEESDLVQSVCREILERRDRFRHPNEGAFRRWLYTTALRKIQDKARYWAVEGRGAIQGDGSADASRDGLLLQHYASICTPSRVAAAREEVERIERAFDELSDEHREVICLARIVGLPHAEIAEHMGRTEEASRKLLYRAIARLSTMLERG